MWNKNTTRCREVQNNLMSQQCEYNLMSQQCVLTDYYFKDIHLCNSSVYILRPGRRQVAYQVYLPEFVSCLGERLVLCVEKG